MARVLIVEDVAEARYLSRTLLEHAGHEVAEAENGAGALTLAERQSFDLVLLDLSLPDMSGVDVVRRMGGTVAIVLHTATSVQPAMEEFMHIYGVRGSIPKPCEPQTFLALVSKYLATPPERRSSAG